ncbi:MAG: metallopeptidase family protein [Desulfotomaculum sp.]|nr:metallopeptidase family protein [Desulfotomaculum sp.]MCL0080887.1 metallopeptidase family protein [Peptococcaceae bacterium]
MVRLSLDEFTVLAGELVDEIPARLCRNLNGGFAVLPEEKREQEFYIMGEYIEDDMLGSYIVFYYGSFLAILGNKLWEEELRETVWHELRHHLESLAGVDDLTREEMEELARFRSGRSARNQEF